MRGRPSTLLVLALVATASIRSAHADARSDLAAARGRHAAGAWAAAESLATAALTGLERDPAADSLEIARACHLLASARDHRRIAGDTLAVRAAERSLAIRTRQLPSDHLDIAASHLLLSRILVGRDRPDSALAHAQRALDIRQARLGAKDTLVAEAWRQLADCQYDVRDPRGASASLEHAIAIDQPIPGRERARADALSLLGLVLVRLDQRDAAKAKEREAIDLLGRTYGPQEAALWDPLNNLAGMELSDGNPARAVDLFRQAREIVLATQGEGSSSALVLGFNQQLCLQQIGDFAGGKELCDELLPKFVEKYGPEHPRTLALRQSRAFANEHFDRDAETLAEFRAIEAAYAKAGGPLNPNHAFVWREIAHLSRRLGRFEEARAACDHAIQLETSSPRPIGSTLLTLEMMKISVLESVGDRPALDSAGVELDRLATQYRLGSLLDRANVEHWRSRIDRACARPASAWTRALASEELARQRFHLNLEASPDRRALQLARRSAIYLDLLLDLASGVPARADSAWDRLVRDRGQSASEMARRRLPADARADTAIAGAHTRWIDAQRRYAARLVQSPPRDSAARADLDRLRAGVEAAEQDVALRLQHRGTPLAPAADPGLAEVRARLAPDAVLVALVEVHAGDDTARVLAFAAGRDGPVQSVDLGASSVLAAAVDPWLAALATHQGAKAGAGAEARSRDLGRRVRALTWDRLAPLAGGAREVFVVGDGPLLDLPWQALPEGAHGYLVEAAPHFHPLPAERDLPSGPAAPRAGSLLAVGAPDFARRAPGGPEAGSPLVAWLRSAPPCAVEAFPPLPGSVTEVRAVAKAWQASGAPAEVLIGAEADEAAFKRAAAGHAVLHIATHGWVLRDSCPDASAGTRGVGGLAPIAKPPGRTAPRATAAPAARATAQRPGEGERVWLAFAGANRAREHHGDENEGLLTAEEVVTLDLEGTDWVVLSACHSAAAEDWRREGTRGMGDAFRFAGARSVIASRWAIADDATAEWMTALYAARTQGTASAAAAVESASRAVLAARRTSGRSTHPFYWAAFGASGE